MRKLLDDIFVGMYHYLAQADGVGRQVSVWNMISTLASLVCFEALWIVIIFLNFGAEYSLIKSKVDSLLVGIALVFLNWVLFAYRGRYIRLLNEFYLDVDENSKRVGWSAFLFASISFFAFVVSVVAAIVHVGGI